MTWGVACLCVFVLVILFTRGAAILEERRERAERERMRKEREAVERKRAAQQLYVKTLLEVLGKTSLKMGKVLSELDGQGDHTQVNRQKKSITHVVYPDPLTRSYH